MSHRYVERQPTPFTEHLDPVSLVSCLMNHILNQAPFIPFALFGPDLDELLSPVSLDTHLLSFISGPLLTPEQVRDLNINPFSDLSDCISSLPTEPTEYNPNDFRLLQSCLPSQLSFLSNVSRVISLPYSTLNLLLFPIRPSSPLTSLPFPTRRTALDYHTLFSPHFTAFNKQLVKSREIHNRHTPGF